jgi:NhaP-type Na+/H+ or K+/H+ antiporter
VGGVSIGFGAALALFGGVVAVLSGLSGYLRDKPAGVPVLAVIAGLVAGYAGGLGVAARSAITLWVVELALLVTLFADGLVVDRALFRRHWRGPLRALAFTMPLTLGAVGLLARLLFPQLSWAEAFLLGSVLSPTDPVVSAAVVTSAAVPARLRHLLNLESGLNDAIASPYVLFFAYLAGGGHGAGAVTARAVTLVAGSAWSAVLGLLVAWAAGWALRRLAADGLAGGQHAVTAVGVALAAFGLAVVSDGNGFLAVFVAAIALAVSSHQVPDGFGDLAAGISSVLQVVVYLIIGALAAAVGLGASWWRLAVFIAATLIVARPAAIGVSFLGLPMPRRERAFVAWFGPKAVASLVYGLLILATTVPHRTLITQVTVFTVLASTLAHSATQHVGTRWLATGARRSDGTQAQPGDA